MTAYSDLIRRLRKMENEGDGAFAEAADAIEALSSTRSETERRNPWRFELDEQQAAKLEAWRKEQDALVLKKQQEAGADDPFIAAVHASGSPYYSAIGGELTFSFSPNSIGEVAKAKHGGTGAEIDLTDYDAW